MTYFYRKAEQDLEKWLNNPNNKPLLIFGARQVGKTTLVKNFIKKHNHQLIDLNFEDFTTQNTFKNVTNISEFIDLVQLHKKLTISKNTVIFLDEIQFTPSVFSLLRFFSEFKTHYKVIATGSWLNLYIKELFENSSTQFPVGRVETLTLYPMTFSEYLKAFNIKLLNYITDNIKNKTIFKLPVSIHNLLLESFTKYITIGGMPGILKIYKEQGSSSAINAQSTLMNSIYQDIRKYDINNADKLIQIIQKIYQNPAQRLSYAKMIPGITFSTIDKLISYLKHAFLIYEVPPTVSTRLPIQKKEKMFKKYLALDTGLAINTLKLSGLFLKTNVQNNWNILLDDEIKGLISEQYVGQSLYALLGTSTLSYDNILYYWTQRHSKAEVDFTFQNEDHIVGVEVKSGKVGRLRSLITFCNKVKNNSNLVRFYWSTPKTETLKIDNLNDKLCNKRLLSLPIYLTDFITEILDNYY